jgi:hypothetical protein
MVKRFFLLGALLLSAADANIYRDNCVSCHRDLPVSIDKYFYRYLLKYSSESAVKAAMESYLKAPSETHSIMPEAFLSRFGVKAPTDLNDTQLRRALDLYWEKYKVFGKLK